MRGCAYGAVRYLTEWCSSDTHISPHKKCKHKPYTVDLWGWKRSAEALNRDSCFLPRAFPAGGHTAAIRSLSTSAPQPICKSSFCLFLSYYQRVLCVAPKAKLFRRMLSSSDAVQYGVTFLVGIRYLTVKRSLGASTWKPSTFLRARETSVSPVVTKLYFSSPYPSGTSTLPALHSSNRNPLWCYPLYTVGCIPLGCAGELGHLLNFLNRKTP